MSVTSSASTAFRQPTGIPFLDRAATVAQASYQQALLVPSRVRRRSSRARAQMFKDFDLVANTESMALQASTHILAARESLQRSGFRLSPTGRTVDPELNGADVVQGAEHVRAERTRRLANRKKDAEEQWSSWKKEKASKIAEKKEKDKRVQENLVRKKRMKKEVGKVAYAEWQRKKKEAEQKKRAELKEKEKKMKQDQLKMEELEKRRRDKKRKEREKQMRLLDKQMSAAMSDEAVARERGAIAQLEKRKMKSMKKKLTKLLKTPYTDPTTKQLLRGHTPGGSKKGTTAPKWLMTPKVAEHYGIKSDPESSDSVHERSKPSSILPSVRGGGEMENNNEVSVVSRPPWDGNEYRAKSRQGLGESGDNDLYLHPAKWTPPTTPNGTKLKRGAGGGLLRPMQKNKQQKKKRRLEGGHGDSNSSRSSSSSEGGANKIKPLLRFRLEEMARPTAVVLSDVASLLVNGVQPKILLKSCIDMDRNKNKNGHPSGALSVEDLEEVLISSKPRLREDDRLTTLLKELGMANGMFGAIGAVRYERLCENLDEKLKEKHQRSKVGSSGVQSSNNNNNNNNSEYNQELMNEDLHILRQCFALVDSKSVSKISFKQILGSLSPFGQAIKLTKQSERLKKMFTLSVLGKLLKTVKNLNEAGFLSEREFVNIFMPDGEQWDGVADTVSSGMVRNDSGLQQRRTLAEGHSIGSRNGAKEGVSSIAERMERILREEKEQANLANLATSTGLPPLSGAAKTKNLRASTSSSISSSNAAISDNSDYDIKEGPEQRVPTGSLVGRGDGGTTLSPQKKNQRKKKKNNFASMLEKSKNQKDTTSSTAASQPAWLGRAKQRKKNEMQKRQRSNAQRRVQEFGTPVQEVPAHALRRLRFSDLKKACTSQEKPPLVVMRVLGMSLSILLLLFILLISTAIFLKIYSDRIVHLFILFIYFSKSFAHSI